MNSKLLIIFLTLVLFSPIVFGYSYVITNLNPSNNSYVGFSGMSCQPITISYTYALQVNPFNPLDYGAWIFGKDIYPGIIYNRLSPTIVAYPASYGAVQHITTSSSKDANFIIANVCYNEVWEWQALISKDGGVSVAAASTDSYFRGQVVNVSYDPPSATNLKSCLGGTGTNCYSSGASFIYSTSMVYPTFNLSSRAARVTVSLYASSNVRGTLPTSVRTTDMGGTSKTYIASGIPVQPGETITWYAKLDDGVHTPITQTSSVTFSINAAPDVPPVVVINSPVNGQHFAYGNTVVLINATANDTDDANSALTVQIYLNDGLQCTLNQASQYYTCDVSTIAAGNYKATVTVVDSVSQNKRNQTIFFTVDGPSSSQNHVPDYNLLPFTNVVARNGSLQFTLNASDRDNDPLWFDIYCQFNPINDTSWHSGCDFTSCDDPFSSTGWAGPFNQPYQYTFTCPDRTKNPAQWQNNVFSQNGLYVIKACVTDGSESNGKAGFSTYNACAFGSITVSDSGSFVSFDTNETIEFQKCLVGDGCILNEFYLGMVGFVSGFLIYFIYIFIVFVIALVAYYIYIKVKEGII